MRSTAAGFKESTYSLTVQALSVPGMMSYSTDRFKPMNLRIESATGSWHAEIKHASNKRGTVGVKAARAIWTPTGLHDFVVHVHALRA